MGMEMSSERVKEWFDMSNTRPRKQKERRI